MCVLSINTFAKTDKIVYAMQQILSLLLSSVVTKLLLSQDELDYLLELFESVYEPICIWSIFADILLVLLMDIRFAKDVEKNFFKI